MEEYIYCWGIRTKMVKPKYFIFNSDGFLFMCFLTIPLINDCLRIKFTWNFKKKRDVV